MKLYVKLPNSKELLDVMQEQIKRYYTASIKKSGRRTKAINKLDYPYFSLYGLMYNKYTFGIRNGEVDSDGSNKKASRHVLARCHWPGGKPAVNYAQNPSEREIWEALWYAESEAYRNYQNVDISDKQILPRHLHMGGYVYKDLEVNQGAIAEYKNLSKPYIINYLKKAEESIRNAHPQVYGSSADMYITIGYSIFADSWGSAIIQELPRIIIALQAKAYADDLEANKLIFTDSVGGTGGKKLLQTLRVPTLRKARRLGQKVVDFAKAKDTYKNGKQKVVLDSMDDVILLLDSDLAGGGVHEMSKAGHMGELDRFIRDEEVARPIKGKGGFKELNIYDYALAEWPPENGIKPASWYKYDAEGTPTDRTHIVRNGKTAEAYTSRQLIGTLQHSLETFGNSLTPEMRKIIEAGKLTGNARIEDVLLELEGGEIETAEPFTRMSTLFIQPSNLKNRTLKNMKDKIRGKDNALYCVGLVEGGVFSETGQGFMIPREVYCINKYGKEIPLRRKRHQIRIIGDSISFMKNIKMIGDASTVDPLGGVSCGAESGFIPQEIISPAFLMHHSKIEAVHLGADKSYKSPLIGPPKRKRTKEL